MGKLWRRYNEQLRQRMAPPLFMTASTERHRELYSRLTTQRNHFRGLTPKIRAMVDSYENLSGAVLESMRSSSTPSSFAERHDRGTSSLSPPKGHARAPIQRELQSVTASSKAMEDKMSQKVLTVLQAWFTKCEECKEKLQELNALKFEVDSRKRTVVSLRAQIDRLELGPIKKHERKEQVKAKLERKQGKYDSALEEFRKKDAELDETLKGLLSEAPSVIGIVSTIYQTLSDVPGIVHGVLEQRYEPFPAINRPHQPPKPDRDLLAL